MPPSREAPRRLTILALLAAWALAVAALTLRSSAYVADPELDQMLCILCGPRDVADIALNWLLFVPLGLGIGWLYGFRWALRVSILVTVGIEGLQLFLPGRHPGLQDVVSNSLGGATGAMLTLGVNGRSFRRVLAGAAVSAWLCSFVLLMPTSIEVPLYGQWTPRRPGMEAYRGRVLAASVGTATTEGDSVRGSAAAAEALRRREPLTVRVVTGPRPRSLSPVLSVFDARGREVVFLGVIGQDLVYRGSTTARALLLDHPDIRWTGALQDVRVGDTLTIRVEPDRDSYCISVDASARCRLAPGPGDGWTFLLNLEGGPGELRSGMTLAWSLGVGAMLGITMTSVLRAGAVGSLLAIAALLGGLVTPSVRPAPLQALLLIAGCLAGAALRRPSLRLLRFFSGEDVQSSAMPHSPSTSTP